MLLQLTPSCTQEALPFLALPLPFCPRLMPLLVVLLSVYTQISEAIDSYMDDGDAGRQAIVGGHIAIFAFHRLSLTFRCLFNTCRS